MSELRFYDGVLLAVFAVAALVAASSVRVVAPYGRFGRACVFYALGDRHLWPASIVFLSMWMFH
jgi:hypothetical protein